MTSNSAGNKIAVEQMKNIISHELLAPVSNIKKVSDRLKSLNLNHASKDMFKELSDSIKNLDEAMLELTNVIKYKDALQ